MPKRWFKQDALPIKIITQPTQKNVTYLFDQNSGVNDEEFVLTLAAKGVSTGAIAFFILAILMLIMSTLIALFSKNVDFDLNFLMSVSFLFIVSFLFWLYSFIKPTKRLVLKRFTGMMTYPSYGFATHITITFNKATVYSTIIAGPDAMVMGSKLMARNPYDDNAFRGTYDLAPADPEEWWSYFVWFMDKNRPLPPGKAFDPYRQKDFERRKAAGFPKPLYESNIPTPEHTKAQQKERQRIGGW